MPHFQTDFLKKTSEATPFIESFWQKFFAEWCNINDGLTPRYISRNEWEQKKRTSILSENTLFLPSDLHIWEFWIVFEALKTRSSPSKSFQNNQKLTTFWETLQKASIYIKEYLPLLEMNARTIALTIAQEFEFMGNAYAPYIFPSISREDKSQIDEWLLGKKVFTKRFHKLGKNPSQESIESYRKHLFSTYFRALTSQGYHENGKNAWSDKTWPIQHLQDRTKEGLIHVLETPKRELGTLVFHRGIEQLIQEIQESKKMSQQRPQKHRKVSLTLFLSKYGFNPVEKYQKLYKILNIPALKRELSTLKSSSDLSRSSYRELEIVKLLHKTISSFDYQEHTHSNQEVNYPAFMHKTQGINCIGASLIGWGFLDTLGIKYVHAHAPFHSLTFLVSGEWKVYWLDFTPPTTNKKLNFVEITPDMLSGVTDMKQFLEVPETGFVIEFLGLKINNKNVVFHITPPEVWLQSHVLNNLANTLIATGKHEEAIESAKQAISIDPHFLFPYNALGNAQNKLKRYQESIQTFWDAVKIEPDSPYWYYGIGNALVNLERYEEALEAFQKAIELNPNYALPYHGIWRVCKMIGHEDEAKTAYENYLNLKEKEER